MQKVLWLFPILVGAAHAQDWQVGAQTLLSYSGVNFTTALDSPYNEAGFRPNMGFRPGFEVRYKNYGLSMTPAITGESQRYSSRPPTLFTDLRLSFYQPWWGVDAYYQYYRGYMGAYGDSNQVRMDFSSMRQSTLLLNFYGSIASVNLIVDPDTHLAKIQRGTGLAYFTESLRDGTGAHLGLFYVVSGFRDKVNNSTPIFADSAVTGSAFDGARKVGITGASVAIGLSGGGGLGDPEDILGRVSDGASMYGGVGAHQTASDAPGAEGFGTHYKIGAKGFVRYDIGIVGLGAILSVDATYARIGKGERVTFSTAMLNFFIQASF